MNTRLGGIGLMGSLALSLCACSPAGDSDYGVESELGFREVSKSTPTRGGWVVNGLEDPSTMGIDPYFALEGDGLAASDQLLENPAARATAEYLVECALPLGQSITKVVGGQTLTFEGLVGVAPEWADDECDQDCQEWVSACMLARTNSSGQEVVIWLQAEHEEIGYGTLPTGAVLEAGFWGNLFADADEQYLCQGSQNGVVAAQRAGRTCSSGACDFTIYSSCSSRCDLTGAGGEAPANCHSGDLADSAPYHTIATYVVP